MTGPSPPAASSIVERTVFLYRKENGARIRIVLTGGMEMDDSTIEMLEAAIALKRREFGQRKWEPWP